MQLGSMKNTTRHKIGKIKLGGLGERCELSQRGLGQSPGSFSTFYVFGGKIQHLINMTAPNLLKFTSRKRDIRERKYVQREMMTLTQYYTT